MEQDAGKDKWGSCPPFWAPLQKRCLQTGVGPAEGHRGGWGLEHTMSEQKWMEPGLLEMEKEPDGDLTAHATT